MKKIKINNKLNQKKSACLDFHTAAYLGQEKVIEMIKKKCNKNKHQHQEQPIRLLFL
jgi:hypothetical protein